MNATNSRPENVELIQQLTQIVLENLDDEKFGATELAKQVGMSRSHLYRKVIALTKKSLSQFIREIRLSEALKLLKEEGVTVSEVVYRVGFNSRSYFNSCFYDYYGIPPGEAKHMNLENILRYKKHEKGSDKLRFRLVNTYAIVAAFLFLVIVTMVTVFFLKRDRNTIEDKSIAVLPFYNDSPDGVNEYFINGTMEAILDHLYKIEDLRIVGRTSVEQYRNNPKPVSEIARELNVRYILEGSGQKYGNNIHLILQLFDVVEEKHLWSSPYDKEIEIAEIFTLQSEIAQMVAEGIKAIITPEELHLIEKIPTISLTAYDFYLRGMEEHKRYWWGNAGRETLEGAEDLFYEALDYDSTFALAYCGLADVYRSKHYWEEFPTENFLDSALILADIALSFDDQLAEAYFVKGVYYANHNQKEQAINEFDKVIKFNPNFWETYVRKSWLYHNDDVVKVLSNLHKAASLHRGTWLPGVFEQIMFTYAHAGFKERAIYYAKEALKLDDDSVRYYSCLAFLEGGNGNYEKAIEYDEKAYAIDSTRYAVIFHLGLFHSYLGQFEESLRYFKELDREFKIFEKSHYMGIFYIGYAYWANGFKEEAESYINTGLEFYNKALELDRFFLPFGKYGVSYSLATVYAFLGDKEKVFEYLGLLNRVQFVQSLWISDIKNNPMFDSIRDEPELQQIVRDVEAKHQAEHERVRQWLEDNEML